MLPVSQVYSALAFAESSRMFEALEKVYAQVPEGDCRQCGQCCVDPPPAALVEYLNIYRYVRDHLADRHQELIRKTVEFFYLELADPGVGCPFLGEDKKCLIHPVRPLSCRVYNVLHPDDYEKQNRTRDLEKVAEKYQREHGITLPRKIIEFRLPYCPNAKQGGRKLRTPEVHALLFGILTLDTRILPSQVVFEDQTMLPPPTHLAVTILNEGLRARRPDVIREYLATGESPLLEKYVERAARFQF